MKIDALAVDIDGTLTDSNRLLCIESIKTLRKLEKHNIPVIFVTGNTAAYTYALTTSIGTTGGVVGENGGVMFKEDYMNNETIVLGDYEYVNKAYEYLKSEIDKNIKLKIVEDSYCRLSEIAFYRTMDSEPIKEILEDWDIKIYDSGFALHLSDKNVNKGKTLKELSKITKIKTKNIMGIGDNENDLEFLDAVGFKVAVSNAREDLKEKADYVCEKPYGLGVSEAIEKFIKI